MATHFGKQFGNMSQGSENYSFYINSTFIIYSKEMAREIDNHINKHSIYKSKILGKFNGQ